VAVVSTATEAARSRRREGCSVTDAMATEEGAIKRACATPATYASRFAVVNSARVMASVAVKVTGVQSEHASQGPPSAPVKPAEQEHCALPDADSEFAGHTLHSAVPTTLLNIPAPHAVHAVPSDVPLYPAMHLQSVNASLPGAERVPPGHVQHSDAPAATLYLPASQDAQETSES